MRMANASSPTKTSTETWHWSQVIMFMLLFIAPLLLGVSFGQTSCGFGILDPCPTGYCCNSDYTCGNTTADCGTNCFSQCIASGIRCGPSYASVPCPDGSCCSMDSWCGVYDDSCGKGNCSSQCPNGICGANANGLKCQNGDCCNNYGFCGNTTGYCGAGWCASQCLPPPPPPSPSPSPLPPPPPPPLPPPSPSPTPSRGDDQGVKAGGKNHGKNLSIIVGLSTGIAVFLIASSIVISIFVWRRNAGGGLLGWAKFTLEDDPMMQLEGMPERFSYKQLSVATRAFSQESKLGQGGFGSVYRGELPSTGILVAVKKINNDSDQGEKEFMAEVSIISRLRHRNLIQLLGWCKDAARRKFLLVYELMPNGSLDKVLFGPADSQTPSLSWSQRLNIVTGTAAALDYLHQGWKQQVIHRDVKSSNIMLDGEWNAKLGDFGLARLVDHQRAAATTVVAGTYGYIAPEAASTGRFTDKTDVFAFGAVVLEIACGRPAFSFDFPAEEIVLVDWVWRSLSEGDLLNTVDQRLDGNYDTYLMEVMLVVGLLCSHPDPEARPSMRHVVQVLAGDVPVPSIPASKPAPVFRSDSQNLSITGLRGAKFRSASSKSKSGSISLVSVATSDSSGGSKSTKSIGTSSHSTSSF